MTITQEGSVTFSLKHEHMDWSTNEAGYNFGVFEVQELKFGAVKHPDRTLELNIDGPLSSKQTAKIPVPPCDVGGLHVGITWVAPIIKVYFNGVIVHTISV